MEEPDIDIRLGYTDTLINNLLTSRDRAGDVAYERHFNQSEEYFLELPAPFEVPSLPIHHNILEDRPRREYLAGIQAWIKGLIPLAPGFFADLTWFFDPTAVLKPCFYRMYEYEGASYLFLLRVDLGFRPLESELIAKGDNDFTAHYRTRRLYLESDLIPLATVWRSRGAIAGFQVREYISKNWIGETGKGYMLRGIWIDTELSKFFTKLILPRGKRSYPYYPLMCKYKTICLSILDPSSDVREALLPWLHRSIQVLAPELGRIQEALRQVAFTESLPVFIELKLKVGETLAKPWTSIQLIPYLNANDQKEYRVEFQS